MKTRIILFIITCILTILHVHVSVCTIENLANPVCICMLCGVAGNISDHYVFYVSSYVIQSIVTFLIAFLLLNYRRMKLWLVVFPIFLPLSFVIEKIISDGLIIKTHIFTIDWFYERLYNDLAPVAFTHIVCFSLVQILLLASYSLCNHFLWRPNKVTNYVISLKEIICYIIIIIFLLALPYLATFTRKSHLFANSKPITTHHYDESDEDMYKQPSQIEWTM